ncbi:MAG: hypothetical protein JWN86_4531 [Planctomycetota bacterium]|nr:hypothetical protein [Planctomycetota bacterium]
MNPPASSDAFTLERHGDVTVILTSPVLETMEPGLLSGASTLLLDAMRRDPCPQLVVDLSQLQYFGSAFLALLIRCWKLATTRGGAMVLAGVSDRAKDLLHMTSLDTVWPIYADVREAIEVLEAE